jgi:hypothetical protein
VATESLIKQPAESRVFSMNFAAMLAAGETLSGVTSVSYTGDDTALVISGPAAYSGAVAQQRILGGTDGQQYKVTFVVTTTQGNILEGEGILQVRNL